MSYTLFIADLHLDASRPAITTILLDFLETHQGQCDALYILGDLFETWIGDDDDTAPGPQVRQALREFTDSGSALFLMHGNRDFLIGDTFCTETSATLLSDPTVIDLYGRPTALLHGDTLCTADHEYQAFRRTARDPAWQKDLLSRSLSERRGLAGQLRAISKEANSNKAEDIMDVSPDAVERVMRQLGVRQMIHGHTHRPKLHSQLYGERWVVGDWGAHAWILVATPAGLSLKNINV